MNRLDVFIVVLLMVFIAVGTWRGFVREILSLLTWVVAGMVAWSFADHLAPRLAGVVEDPALQFALGFVLLFILIFAIAMIGAWWLDRFLAKRKLFRIANRVFGAVFGVLRGTLVLVIIFLLAGLTALPQKPWWRDSALAPYFQTMVLYVNSYLPHDIARHVRYS